MKIIPSTVEDIYTLNTLVQQCYRGESSRKGWTHEADLLDGTRITPEMLKEEISNPNIVILKCLDDEGNIIGCVSTEMENDKMYVGMLCVRPDLQAAGLGKKIMSAVDELAKQKGCCAAKMKVISRRVELINFYERRGFRKTGETAPFPTGEQFGQPKVPLEMVVMQKDY